MRKQINRQAEISKPTILKSSRLNIVILLLSFIFCIGVFKNISYPLIWNDESDTIMTAEKVLEFGYPKVHDGKNIVFLPVDTTWIGYKKEIDANISMTWGCYYYGAIGAFLANHVDDMYVKTALVRIPFAISGVIGMIIFVISLRGFFNDKKTYQKFIILFVLIELLSVMLFLHMREARYYSLVIFITACFFYVFIHYFIHTTYSFKKYLLLMTLILFTAYQINIMAFAACCLTIGFYEACSRLFIVFSNKEKGEMFSNFMEQLKMSLKNLLPILVCIILISPFVVFFETFSNAAKGFNHYNVTSNGFISQLERLIFIFKNQEFFYPTLFAKVLQIIIWYSQRNKQLTNKNAVQESSLNKLTFFMSLFFICFCLVVASLPFLFTRYFIVLQPIMVMILLIDLVIILKYISTRMNKRTGNIIKIVLGIILIRLVLLNAEEKIKYEKNYIYQITHQFKGPLDYLIPYIKENYKNPENLVLATNYEELSYMFYLGCKVTLGSCNKNLKEDLKYQPDIMIYRKNWGQNPEYYNQFAQKAVYQKLAFPVFDYPVNNIPEFYGNFEHQFKTKLAENENEKTEIFVKEIHPLQKAN